MKIDIFGLASVWTCVHLHQTHMHTHAHAHTCTCSRARTLSMELNLCCFLVSVSSSGFASCFIAAAQESPVQSGASTPMTSLPELLFHSVCVWDISSSDPLPVNESSWERSHLASSWKSVVKINTAGLCSQQHNSSSLWLRPASDIPKGRLLLCICERTSRDHFLQVHHNELETS